MPTNDEKIKNLIDSGLIGKIGEIDILPRWDDLPNHYVKGQNEKEITARKEAVINMESNISSSLSSAEPNIRVGKHKGNIVIDSIDSRSRYVIKKTKNGKFHLLTGIKIRERQLEKAKTWKDSTIVSNESELESLLRTL